MTCDSWFEMFSFVSSKVRLAPRQFVNATVCCFEGLLSQVFL